MKNMKSLSLKTEIELKLYEHQLNFKVWLLQRSLCKRHKKSTAKQQKQAIVSLIQQRHLLHKTLDVCLHDVCTVVDTTRRVHTDKKLTNFCAFLVSNLYIDSLVNIVTPLNREELQIIFDYVANYAINYRNTKRA